MTGSNGALKMSFSPPGPRNGSGSSDLRGKGPENLSRMPSRPPVRDRESGSRRKKDSRRRKLEERNLVEGISGQLITECHRHEQDEKRHEQVIEEILSTLLQQLPAQNYSRNLTKLLFHIWALHDYDGHMARSKHDLAIDLLLGQLLAIGGVVTDTKQRMLGHDMLEAAGGTGTVIKLLSGHLTPEELSRLNITLNDLSVDMKAEAKAKLRDLPCRVSYTGHDIRYKAFPDESRDLVMMAQLLHLLTDPQQLERERRPDYLITGSREHILAKINAIQKMFDALRWDGHFALIDEWPATLSATSGNTIQRVIEQLFARTFRPVLTRGYFRDKIMKNVPEARFVAELKIPIDAFHAMYLLLYRKDRDKVGQRLRCPMADGFDQARMLAEQRVIEAFYRIDRFFVERYSRNHLRPEGEAWVEFRDIGSSGPVFDTREGEEVTSRRCCLGSAVLRGALNGRSEAQVRDYIHRTVNALKIGGALMVLNEFPTDGAVSTHYFRDTLMENFPMVFEGSLRAHIQSGYDSGVYGYLYRKVKA